MITYKPPACDKIYKFVSRVVMGNIVQYDETFVTVLALFEQKDKVSIIS